MRFSPLQKWRLKTRYSNVWKEAGADPVILSLIRDGHKIVFDDGPPPCSSTSDKFETKVPEAKMSVIREETETPKRILKVTFSDQSHFSDPNDSASFWANIPLESNYQDVKLKRL